MEVLGYTIDLHRCLDWEVNYFRGIRSSRVYVLDMI